jgi:hypothetical protein
MHAMGLLDSIGKSVSNLVTRTEETASEAVKEVSTTATELGHAAESAFELAPPPAPSAPPPPPASAPSFNGPTFSARALALNPQLVRSQVTAPTPSTVGGAGDSPDAQAQALIKKHTSWGMLDEAGLGKELGDMAKSDPVGSAAVIKATLNKLPSDDVDDVSAPFVQQAGPDALRKLAELPDGADALAKAKTELGTGWVTDDEKAAIAKIDEATTEAGSKDFTSEKQHQLAALTYHNNGDKPLSLNDPAQVKQLIQNSPQLDDLPGTTTDNTRCGGAALLNSMLLSGDPAANAGAIERTVAKMGVTPTADQAAAIAAMKSGSMTPHQAAQLQELLTKAAETPQPDDASRPNFVRGDPNAGFSMQAMADMMKRLRSEGAFANAQSVTIHMEGNHFTSQVTDKSGVTTGANSWPENNGKASTDPLPPEQKNFLELTLKNLPDGNITLAGRGALFVHDPMGTGDIELPYPPMESQPKDPKGPFDFTDWLVQFAVQKPVMPNLD